MKDRWTAAEYQEYLRTNREPNERRASPTCCQKARSPEQEAIERAWEKAEREGRVMALDIPVSVAERQGQPTGSATRNGGDRPIVPKTEEQAGKKRKYRNEPVTVDGIRFDSKHEARVYQELMLRVKTGELKCVLRQVKFDLGGGPHAQTSSRYQYVADFVTIDRENKATVIDAKSEITRKNRTYINKKRQMLSEWGMEIEEV